MQHIRYIKHIVLDFGVELCINQCQKMTHLLGEYKYLIMDALVLLFLYYFTILLYFLFYISKDNSVRNF